MKRFSVVCEEPELSEEPNYEEMQACRYAIENFAIMGLQGLYPHLRFLPYLPEQLRNELIEKGFVEHLIAAIESDDCYLALNLIESSLSQIESLHWSQLYQKGGLTSVIISRLETEHNETQLLKLLRCLSELYSGENISDLMDRLLDVELPSEILVYRAEAIKHLLSKHSIENLEICIIQSLSKEMDDEHLLIMLSLLRATIEHSEDNFVCDEFPAKRCVSLLQDSETKREQVLYCFVELTRHMPYHVIGQLVEADFLSVLKDCIGSNQDHLVLQIAANIAAMSYSGDIIRTGFVQLLANALENGSHDAKIAAANLAANIMWRGSYSDIYHLLDPIIIGSFRDFLDSDDIVLDGQFVLLDGLYSALIKEEEVHDTRLHEVLDQYSFADVFTKLSESPESTIADLAAMILQLF